MWRGARALGVQWAIYGIQEQERYGPQTLAALKQSGAPVATAYPEFEPAYYLFDFRKSP